MWPILFTILLSAVKFAMTFPLAILQFQFSFFETILWTNIGGVVGIYFFAFLSEKLISWWNRTFRRSEPPTTTNDQKEKRIFTRRNRRIVRIKQRYGLIGIAVSTPFLLSIPVGAFLVVRYYPHAHSRFLYLIFANLLWSVIYTGFYMFWDGLLFQRI
ncbi:MAG: hypothetical protein ACWGNV_04735 [Bacteroidales bacterium]